MKSRSIITVVGVDQVGIIARVCNYLSDANVNVLDISQTVMQGSFTMVMAVDAAGISVSFAEIAKGLAELGSEMGLTIRIQREEIFDAMHTV